MLVKDMSYEASAISPGFRTLLGTPKSVLGRDACPTCGLAPSKANALGCSNLRQWKPGGCPSPAQAYLWIFASPEYKCMGEKACGTKPLMQQIQKGLCPRVYEYVGEMPGW
jgi:hypothetical protein